MMSSSGNRAHSDESELLTLPEVAARLRLCNNTVYRMCRKGVLPARKVGRQWRIRAADLTEWLKSKDRAASARPGAGADPVLDARGRSEDTPEVASSRPGAGADPLLSSSE